MADGSLRGEPNKRFFFHIANPRGLLVGVGMRIVGM
jgi:hypothetical protein